MGRNFDDDDENPFDGVFDGIDQITTGMMGGETDRIDVHEYEDEIRVVADIPGAEREDIKVRCDGRNLAIRASAAPRPFVTRVELPAYVDDQSAHTTFNNGVLEIALDRDNDPANIGFQ